MDWFLYDRVHDSIKVTIKRIAFFKVKLHNILLAKTSWKKCFFQLDEIQERFGASKSIRNANFLHLLLESKIYEA